MYHAVLDMHDAIAWDIDGTLLGGNNSEFFRAYIVAHPAKQHHLVTFRDPQGALLAVPELTRHGVTRSLLGQVCGCPQSIYAAWGTKRLVFDQTAINTYMEWKAKTASELGCTVLVDDAPTQVARGCGIYGIALVNALDTIT